MARLFIAVLIVLTSTSLAMPTIGSAQPAGVAAEIRRGNCEALGDVAAPLDVATLPDGAPRGNAAALTAASSFTIVPLPLAALTESDHAIDVLSPDGEELAACGEIGGALTESGALVVGIGPRGEAGISGIAYLNPAADPALTNVSFFVSGEGLEAFLGASFSPPVAEDDAARFAAALKAREGARHLAGPIGNPLPQGIGVFVGSPAGITVADFSATATFVNPRTPFEVPWDVGIAFHVDLEQSVLRGVYLDSGGSWYYADTLKGGIQQSGAAPSFDPSPGGANTLDLVVDGGTALFGVNGAFVARIELPAAMTGDVMAATNFHVGNVVEDREVTLSNFQVWDAPDLDSLPTTPATAAGPDDATRFADALAARTATTRDAGPFADALVQRQGSLALWGSETTLTPFSATVTFVNPTEQTKTPWEVGFDFAWLPGRDAQNVYVDSEGFWYSAGTRAGFVPGFDTAPGAANSLDLVVEGDAALFGVNGAFVARLDLPTPTGSGLFVGTAFSSNHVVDGREIAFRDFTVWR